MRTFLGAVIIMLGVLLMIWSLGATDSLHSQVSSLFSGPPANQSQWMLIGGVLALLVGMALGFSHRQRPRTQ
ncbi:MAG TPA: DUF3185 family protein [Planctomycetota bacterium]|nr:DUF3185 family protein [Planctomycetota bacterium]